MSPLSENLKTTFQFVNEREISSDIKSTQSSDSCQQARYTSDIFSFQDHELRLLAVLFPYGSERDEVQISYPHIALRLGRTKRQAQRLVKAMAEKGVILKTVGLRGDGSGLNEANKYSLHPSINKKELGYQLQGVLPSLKSIGLSVVLLFSMNFTNLRHVTLIKYKGIENLKTLNNEKVKRAKMKKEAPAFHPAMFKLPKTTTWQRVMLSAFPQDALTHAVSNYLERRDTIVNPVGYVIDLCRKYCQDRNLEPNTIYAGELALSLGVSPANPEPTRGKSEPVNYPLPLVKSLVEKADEKAPERKLLAQQQERRWDKPKSSEPPRRPVWTGHHVTERPKPPLAELTESQRELQQRFLNILSLPNLP